MKSLAFRRSLQGACGTIGHAKISQGIAHRLRAALSFCFHHQVPQAGFAGGHSKASKRADPRNMWIGGREDRERTCKSGSCTSVVEHAAAGIAEPDHAGCEGEKQPSLGKGIPEFAKGVLGAAPLGERVLCVHNRKCD